MFNVLDLTFFIRILTFLQQSSYLKKNIFDLDFNLLLNYGER